MKVCRMHRSKISSRIRREEFKPIPKGYSDTDFLVERYPLEESSHVIETIGKYAEADA